MAPLIPVPPDVARTASLALATRSERGGGTARGVVIATALTTGYVRATELGELRRWHTVNPDAVAEGHSTMLAGLYGGAPARAWTAAAMNPAGEGAMIALPIPDGVSVQIARADGEPPEEMHLTLFHFGGNAADLDPALRESVDDVLREVTQGLAPPTIVLSHVERFSLNDDGVEPVVVVSDSPDVYALRSAVEERLDGFSDDHAFRAHVTIGYYPPGEGPEAGPVADVLGRGPWTITPETIEFHWGTEVEHSPLMAPVTAAFVQGPDGKLDGSTGEGKATDDEDGGEETPAPAPKAALNRWLEGKKLSNDQRAELTEFVKENGRPTEVKLYRGELDRDKYKPLQTKDTPIKSWSESRTRAKDFSSGTKDANIQTLQPGEGFGVRVLDYKDQLGTKTIGPGIHDTVLSQATKEREWILIDDVKTAAIAAASTPLGAKLARLSQTVNHTNRQLAARLHSAATVALGEAIRQATVKVNMKARTKAMQAAVTAAGENIMPMLAAVGVSEQELLDRRFDTFSAYAASLIAAAERRKLMAAAAALGLDRDEIEVQYGETIDARAVAAAGLMVASLGLLARSALSGHSVTAETAVGEFSGPVPFGVVRQALDVASRGASAPLLDETGPGPSAIDELSAKLTDIGSTLVEDVLGEAGVRVQLRSTWVHGDPERPFEPHAVLDGLSWVDTQPDELAWDASEFPYVDVLQPGDHLGDTCTIETEYEPYDGEGGVGAPVGVAAPEGTPE